MISGLDINLTVGGFTVNRLPQGVLELNRGAVSGRFVFELPDPRGELSQTLKKDDAVDLYFGYRGGLNQSWQGSITRLDPLADRLKVTALDDGLKLIKTKVSECFHNEPAQTVVKRLFNKAGLNPARIEGPDEIIPHLIFSGQKIFECFKQINATLERVYQLDLKASPYWLDENGRGYWGDFDMPGAVPVLASVDNLISHDPQSAGGTVKAILCPGLNHSQLIKIKDGRRASVLTVRAVTVKHKIGWQGNLTTVTYGAERGYG